MVVWDEWRLLLSHASRPDPCGMHMPRSAYNTVLLQQLFDDQDHCEGIPRACGRLTDIATSQIGTKTLSLVFVVIRPESLGCGLSLTRGRPLAAASTQFDFGGALRCHFAFALGTRRKTS